MKPAITLLFLIGLLGSVRVNAQIVEDANAAFKMAEANNRYILLVFAGSDWCAPCMRLEKKVLSQKSFQNFAAQKLLVLEADFPQRKKISPAMQKQNEALAERYNPQGIFPYLLLLRPDGSVITHILYRDETPAEFIETVSRYIDHEQVQGVQATN